MPRPNSYGEDDRGADGLGSSVRRSAQSSRHRSAANSFSSSVSGSSSYNDESKREGGSSGEAAAVDADLSRWERRLAEEVDEDLFDDPRRFHTLQRVIDVLGLQLIDDAATVQSGAGPGSSVLGDNPAYRDLKRQQKVVEEAIEHMSMILVNIYQGISKSFRYD